MSRPRFVTACAALAAAAALPSVCVAGHVYQATLSPLNGSGVSGTALIRMEDDGRLHVELQATGLEEGVHPQHIHGFPDGRDSVTPPESAGGDASSELGTLLSVAEGAPFYGPILLPLDPTPSGTSINFSADYTDEEARQLSAGAAEMLPGLAVAIDGLDDLNPLDLREIVVHGMTVDGVYQPTIPVAAGVITAADSTVIPLPAAAWPALATMAAAGGARLIRRRRALA